MRNAIITSDELTRIQVSSYLYGGVGAGQLFKKERIKGTRKVSGVPYCAVGCLSEPGTKDMVPPTQLVRLSDGVSVYTRPYDLLSPNDRSVRRINRRKGKRGKALNDRVSFRAWLREMTPHLIVVEPYVKPETAPVAFSEKRNVGEWV